MRQSQKGSTLAISLVLLTSVTLGAVYAMQRSGVQLKLVSNLQYKQSVSNSLQSELQAGFKQFQASNDSLTHLMDIFDARILGPDGSPVRNADDQIQYSELGLFPENGDRPAHDRNVKVTSSIRLVEKSSPPGYSMHGTARYVVLMQGQASDKADNFTTRQEQRFTYDGPKAY